MTFTQHNGGSMATKTQAKQKVTRVGAWKIGQAYLIRCL